jgi:hypothetical protein
MTGLSKVIKPNGHKAYILFSHVVQVIPRQRRILHQHHPFAAFAGTPDDALVVGDFVVLEGELQTVLKTLRGADINIVAIHQHMTGDNPRMIFLHYYGRGKALTLAEGVKAAIDTQPLAANK